MIKVLMVCLGNICRSPMAEAVLRHKVASAGLSGTIEIDSAGTGDWHVGAPPHSGTRSILTENHISTDGMLARQISAADLEHYDYIITMDDANLANVRGMGAARGVVRPLLEYAPQLNLTEVPDPYYTGGFGGVYTMIDTACDGLLAAIRAENGI